MSQTKKIIITDCILSTPETLSKSYSKVNIEKSYVDIGMFNSATKSSPDLYGMMELLISTGGTLMVARNGLS